MSALSSLADLIDNASSYSASFAWGISNTSLVIGAPTSSWIFQGGTTPGAAAALSSPDPKSLIYVPATCSKSLWLTEAEFAFNTSGPGVRASAFLYDRLSHSGGLVANVTTEQTTNLPTAALPRYTTGVGVMPFLEMHASITGISTTFTIKYTNQAGVSGQVSQPVSIITNTNAEIKTMIAIPLADGDTGVRSVESLTFAGAGTSAGSVAVVLMKRIAMLPPDTGSNVERQAYRNYAFGGGVAQIQPGAFLQLVIYASTANTGAHSILGKLGITEK